LPLLHWLQERGVGEAAFYLGVGATRAGAFADALKWMERALSLDPGHVETQQQVENLKRLLQEQ
jgi:cytochrome c-type biogenesis protein CcmH/NrfG